MLTSNIKSICVLNSFCFEHQYLKKIQRFFLLFPTWSIKSEFLDWSQPQEFQAVTIFTVVFISISWASEVFFIHIKLHMFPTEAAAGNAN